MEEKRRSSYVSVGTISMQGGLKTGEVEEEEVSLSTSIEDFKSGKLACIIGHAESWMSKTAGAILDTLQKKGLILFNFLDEAHTPLKHHWDTFRPQMKLVPGMLRGRAVRGSPTLAMTATLTEEEIGELQKNLGLRTVNTTVLQSNPIQNNHKYVK